MSQANDQGSGRDHVVVQGVAFGHARARRLPDLLPALLDALPTAVVVAGADGRVVTTNTAAEQLFGYGRDAMSRLFVDSLVSGSARTGGNQFVARVDGSQLPVDLDRRTLRIGDDAFVLLMATDAAPRLRLEREAARQRDEIAHLSRVAMLGELSSALAHELNQPLSAIMCNAQAAQRLLRNTPTNLDDIREIIDDIVIDDRHAGAVIQRLRKWLRKEHVDPVALVLNGVVIDALHLVRADLLQRGVDVHLELAGELPQVAGDRVQLQQVIINLVMNGCDAMSAMPAPRGLRVRTQAIAGKVQLEVVDQGRGIDPDVACAMFEPFVTTKPDGMGMGLAVCRTIIDAHGGRIWGESLAGGGARVAFELPGLAP